MIQKKKVLFVATVDSHIKHFHLPYLELFQKQDYEIHVATGESGKIPFCNKKHQISIKRSPFSRQNLKAIFELKKIIQKESFDIIHCHTPMGGVITRLAAKNAHKNGTRVIYTAHGFHFYKGAPFYYWVFFYSIEKFLTKYTDTLITINLEDYQLAKRHFKKCHDIKYIPGVGVDSKKFEKIPEKEKTALRSSLGLSKNDFVIIFPAEISKRKRQVWLIESLSNLLNKHDNIHLILVGQDSLNGLCQKNIIKHNLSKQIHLLGYRTDISQLLQISDLAISSARQEGLPINIIEAMFAGLPIVATDCRGNRDLIFNDKNGKLINLNNKNSFAKAIESYFKNPAKRQEITNHNKKDAKKYSLENIIPEYEKIYFRKKHIIYIRNNAIYNDARAQKEIISLKRDFDITVLGWNRDCEQIPNQPYLVSLFNKKATYGSGLKNILNILSFQKWIVHELKHIENIDYIYACDFDTAFTSQKFAKKHNKKFIYDIYDYYVDCHAMPNILRKIIEKKDINTINVADLVIVCTENRKVQISKATPKKLAIIPNSTTITKKILTTKICKTNDNNRIKLAYIGILQDDRLLLELCDEVKRNPNFELHIGGFGKYATEIANYSKKSNNIFYYNRMSHDDALSLEKDCDILFATYNPEIPNHKYSAPNKVYEAIALQKPIIVCKNTGIDNFIRKEMIGFTIAYDAKEILEKAQSISHEQRVNIQKRCKKLYYEKYDWEIVAEKLSTLLKEIK